MAISLAELNKHIKEIEETVAAVLRRGPLSVTEVCNKIMADRCLVREAIRRLVDCGVCEVSLNWQVKLTQTEDEIELTTRICELDEEIEREYWSIRYGWATFEDAMALTRERVRLGIELATSQLKRNYRPVR